MTTRRRLALAAILLAGSVGLGAVPRPAAAAAAPTCAPGHPPVVLTGSVTPADAKTYRDLPFQVAPGTTRVEVGYRWDDAVAFPPTPGDALVHSVLDLGLWDEGGVGTPAGFRGWSGSRQGLTAKGMAPVWVQADTAERGYRPDPVQPGTWNVDLGIATVAPFGATYAVTVRCLAVPVGAPFVAHPVDPTHVADPQPGWYMGDMHMHAYHSNPHGPDEAAMVAYARKAGLDFLPITEYVTNQHHRELGVAQAANPDLLIWPSREVITYFGHATVFGETPDVVDWRHGAPGVSLRTIEDKSVADGALFGVAHPTTFPGPLASFCRGCEFTLGDVIDWDEVTTIEVSNSATLVDDSELGGPGLGVKVQNPFMLTAIDLWQRLLLQGHKITGVAGSDDKLGPDYGTTVTAVYARQLSRPALQEALKAGHAYVRTLGTAASPTLEMTAVAPDGERGMFGDTLHADAATVRVRVRGGKGQAIAITEDGVPAGVVPIPSDDFTHTFTATRSGSSGPLGTFWRVDTFDLHSLTTIGNPIFLAGPQAAAPTTTVRPTPPSPPTSVAPGSGRRTLPRTGGSGAGPAAAALLLGGLALVPLVRRRPTTC